MLVVCISTRYNPTSCLRKGWGCIHPTNDSGPPPDVGAGRFGCPGGGPNAQRARPHLGGGRAVLCPGSGGDQLALLDVQHHRVLIRFARQLGEDGPQRVHLLRGGRAPRAGDGQAPLLPVIPDGMTLPDLGIAWDGETLRVGGVPLAPGRYRYAGTGSVIEVAEPADDE